MVTRLLADALPSGALSPASAFAGYFLLPVVVILLFLWNRRLRRKRDTERCKSMAPNHPT